MAAAASTDKFEPNKAGGASGGLAGIVKVVVNTFLEQKHFRQLHRTLSDQWSGCHSLTAAVRLMEAHGVRINSEEELKLSQLPEERMIDALVQKMPQQSREQFEHFFLQLSFIASTTTRLRTALEAGLSDAIEDALESAENVGVLPYIMKMAVAQAGQEVKTTESQHEQWIADMDIRMKPLLQSQANSMSTQKALAQARAEVEAAQVDSKEKSAAVLMGLTAGNDRILVNTAFVAWGDLCKKMRRENEIRKEYEEQINESQRRLMEYKETQLTNVKNVLQRTASEANSTLIASVVGALRSEAERIKYEKAAQAEVEQLESQLRQFADTSAANAKKVMARMSDGTDDGLRVCCFNAWVQHITNFKKDAEMNEAVRAAEMKVASFMKNQKEGAKSVLQRMTQASESGLVQQVFQGWAEAVIESKQASQMEEQLQQKSSKLAQFSTRNKGSAKNASERNAELQDESVLMYFYLFWLRETRCERMRRFGKEKTNKKKQELMGVKSLFKNFAGELETNLKKGTPRVEASKGKGKRAEGSPSP